MKDNFLHKNPILIVIAVGIIAIVICLIIIIAKQSVATSDTVVPTLSQYNSIDNGMSYEQVKKVMGCDGKLLKESGSPGGFGYFADYRWGAAGASKTIEVVFDENGVEWPEETGLLDDLLSST